jgi:hypothetical protein
MHAAAFDDVEEDEEANANAKKGELLVQGMDSELSGMSQHPSSGVFAVCDLGGKVYVFMPF